MELTRLKQQWHKEWAKTAERDRAIKANEQSSEREDALLDRLATMHRRWYTSLGPKTRAAFRAFRDMEAAEANEADDWRFASIDAEDARTALGQAQTEWDAEEAREALSEAEALQAAHQADLTAAEAEYIHWFSEERRAKVWWAIDVVFGAVSGPDEDSGEEKA